MFCIDAHKYLNDMDFIAFFQEMECFLQDSMAINKTVN